MNTPIYDFLKSYAERDTVRLHMPGHKGCGGLGVEKYDLTEIDGADVLYHAEGIIEASEANATSLFGSAHTFYSTEGSTLCIKAMLAIATSGRSKCVLAARNSHKAFVYAAALLDLDVVWLYGNDNDHLCRCDVSAEDVRTALENMDELPSAVYITSPDYLGNMADIRGISEVCRQLGVMLLVDNAHGAYLKFLTPSLHPLDLGAHMCCDSAHKTLPVLTGGAYLHISKDAPMELASSARAMLSVFASTSPSYLILASLDRCNAYLADGYSHKLSVFTKALEQTVEKIRAAGFDASLSEPLKLVIEPLSAGYTGEELGDLLRASGIEPELCDKTCAVLMATPENTSRDLERLISVISKIPKKQKIALNIPIIPRNAHRALSIREAVFSPRESVSIADGIGRICASPTVACPPAVPIAVSGEVLTKEHMEALEFYGITQIDVIKKH